MDDSCSPRCTPDHCLSGVCAGAKVVGAAGLLDGKKATTHWYYLNDLRDRTPSTRYVAEGEPVFVWLARWPNRLAADRFARRFAALSGWRDTAPETILPALAHKFERICLDPTGRSPLR